MKIGLLTGDYSVDTVAGSGGGIDTYVRQLAAGLAAAGHEVHIVARSRKATRTFAAHGATVHAIRTPSSAGAPAGSRTPQAADVLEYAWHAWRKLRDIAATYGPFAVVEAAEYKAPAFFAVRDRSLPVAVKCHAHLLLCLEFDRVPLTEDLALIAALEQEALRRARFVHSNSAALADRVAADYGLERDRIAIIPCGVDTALFRPTAGDIRRRHGLGSNRIVLFVGRMEERKGISTLADAFARVADRVPDVVLMLAGPDAVAPPANDSNVRWLCSRWERLGVEADRYLFLGMVPHSELPSYYSAATISVAPSPFEAFGLVYAESMACGCPPIGCLTGGASEVIDAGKTGLLVPPNEPASLADAMTALLDDPCRRVEMADAGQRRVADVLSIEATVRRTIAYYQEALA